MLKQSFNVSPVHRNQKLSSIGFFKVSQGQNKKAFHDQAVRGKSTFDYLDSNLIIRHTGLQKHVHKIDNYQGP